MTFDEELQEILESLVRDVEGYDRDHPEDKHMIAVKILSHKAILRQVIHAEIVRELESK